MKSSILNKVLIASVFVAGFSLRAAAQAGTVEVAAGGGLASYHASGDSSNKGKFDASVSVNVLKTVAVGFEYGYSPLASADYSSSGVSSRASASLQNFGGVVRVGFLPEPKLQPYVLFAGGGERAKATASATSGSTTVSASDTETGGYFGFGGGLNARIGGGFGVRPEVRYQRVSISGNGLNEIDFTGSLYYTFGAHHKK